MRSVLTSLLLLTGPLAVHAQYILGHNATFAEGPARQEVEAALIYIDVEPPCSLIVHIQVDRAGTVLSAEVDPATCTCADKEVQAQALTAVRERKFNAAKEAPKVQRGTVVWEYRAPEREFGGGWDTNVAVPPPPIPSDEAHKVHDAVEEAPEFPGGAEAMRTYIAGRVRYPEDARADKVEGKVFIGCVVQADGQVTDIVLRRGLHPSLDKEAIRVMKGMPKWTPGRTNGQPVATRFTVPIEFRLP
jgi:TonB family protein